MRVLRDIPHELYKIQIFQYNEKYIVKIELDQFEQTYKIGQLDVNSLDEIENMVTDQLLSNALKRFVQMREDWQDAFANKNK